MGLLAPTPHAAALVYLFITVAATIDRVAAPTWVAKVGAPWAAKVLVVVAVVLVAPAVDALVSVRL